MNYTVPSNRPFVTNKEVKMQKEMSAGYKARKEFVATHDISVTIDPITKEPVVKVTKK